MSLLRRVLIVPMLVFLSIGSSFALDASQTLSQVSHTAWLTQDGFFSGSPEVISQDTRGYLWVGTSSGVDLFDGSRFSKWKPANATDATSASVLGLVRGRDDRMWIATDRELYDWKDGIVTAHNARGRINDIKQDASGAIFYSRSRIADEGGALCEIHLSESHCYGPEEGIPFKYALSLATDSKGNVWVASSTQLARWKHRTSELFEPDSQRLKLQGGLTGITAVVERPGSGVWVGMHYGAGSGLQQLVGNVWTSVTLPGFDGSQVNVNALFVDREDNLWVGTSNEGVYRLSGNRVDHFSRLDGLSGDAVTDIFEDGEKNIWLATTKGIDRFRNLRVTNYSLTEGLSADEVGSVLPDKDGTVWVGNALGLDAIKSTAAGVVVSKAEQFKSRITSLMQDRAGRMWVGNGTELWVKDGKRLTRIERPSGKIIGVVTSIVEATDGSVWFSTTPRLNEISLTRLVNERVSEEFSESQVPTVLSLAADSRDGIWLGYVNGTLGRYQGGHFYSYPIGEAGKGGIEQLTIGKNETVLIGARRGFVEWRDGVAHTLSEKNGLPCAEIFSFITDLSENLWLYTRCGIIEVTRENISAWHADPDVVLTLRHWDVFDGADPSGVPFRPAAGRSPDGRLWFANGRVVQMIDPRHLIENHQPPPVWIERFAADRKEYGLNGAVGLPSMVRDVEVDFTAPSFVMPPKLRFKYMLEGYDDSWKEAVNRRQAFYTNLSPGKYRFHVIAANEDGVWNNTGAALAFSIARAWYQMTWFAIVCLLLFILIVASIYRLRIRQIRKALITRFNDRLSERTRLAQELHDTLIQTIQGSKLVAADALDKPTDLGHMRHAMEKLSTWLSQAIEEGRMALNSLRSATTQTGELMKELCREIEHCKMLRTFDTEVSLSNSEREIVPVVYSELSRIGCEAIRNAVAHSMGSKLTLSMTAEDGICLRVGDDGIGIDLDLLEGGKAGHYGLQGMRERAERIGARLAIHRSPNGGTQVEVSVPEKVAFLDRQRRFALWRPRQS